MSARQPAAAAGGNRAPGNGSADVPARSAAGPGRRPRRRWAGAGLVQAPGRLRSLVRRSEGGLVALATLVGCVAGVAVSAMTWITQTLRELLYQLPAGARLSAVDAVSPALLLVGLCLGGAVLGLLIVAANYVRGPRRRPAIDPIEANALHGGRMSLRDSLYLALQNVISNGSGASVGLEAGYTQIASGLASRLGIAFEVRRSDLRTLVGCGAAGAIAAGFGAPLAGAFYAFELIIGTYSIATLTPVVVAALCGNLISRALIEAQPLVDLGDMQAVTTSHVTSLEILPSLALGLFCAGLGILIMRGVTLVERLVQASGVPRVAAPRLRRPVRRRAALLLATPQVLSGGHGALHMHFAAEGQGHGIAVLAALVRRQGHGLGDLDRLGLPRRPVLRVPVPRGHRRQAVRRPRPGAGAAAGGFRPDAARLRGDRHERPRGGGHRRPAHHDVPGAGGHRQPADHRRRPGGGDRVLLTVRKTFGYSFATWRFHLRGESIRSPHDVGWIRSLTVGRLMRRNPGTVALDTPLPTFLRAHPLGSPSRVIAVDGAGATPAS